MPFALHKMANTSPFPGLFSKRHQATTVAFASYKFAPALVINAISDIFLLIALGVNFRSYFYMKMLYAATALAAVSTLITAYLATTEITSEEKEAYSRFTVGNKMPTAEGSSPQYQERKSNSLRTALYKIVESQPTIDNEVLINVARLLEWLYDNGLISKREVKEGSRIEPSNLVYATAAQEEAITAAIAFINMSMLPGTEGETERDKMQEWANKQTADIPMHHRPQASNDASRLHYIMGSLGVPYEVPPRTKWQLTVSALASYPGMSSVPSILLPIIGTSIAIVWLLYILVRPMLSKAGPTSLTQAAVAGLSLCISLLFLVKAASRELSSSHMQNWAYIKLLQEIRKDSQSSKFASLSSRFGQLQTSPNLDPSYTLRLYSFTKDLIDRNKISIDTNKTVTLHPSVTGSEEKVTCNTFMALLRYELKHQSSAETPEATSSDADEITLRNYIENKANEKKAGTISTDIETKSKEKTADISSIYNDPRGALLENLSDDLKITLSARMPGVLDRISVNTLGNDNTRLT